MYKNVSKMKKRFPSDTSILADAPKTYRDELKKLTRSIKADMEEKGPDYEWSLNDFLVGSPMGRGKFGRVYLAKERNTGYIVAIKLLIKSELLKNNMEHQVLREIEIQTRLNHPHILPLLTYFSDDKRIYLVLHYAAKGELYRYIRQQPNRRLSEEVSAKFIDQVADAVDYCHQNQVIHRDIKPENILLQDNGDIMLCDFGWSIFSPSNNSKTVCGTLDYIPPEMVENRTYNEKVDNWSVGVLCYDLIVGRAPFEDYDQTATFKRIKKVDIVYPSFISAGAKDLISRLLKYRPEERLSMTKVRKHKWILAKKSKAVVL